MKIYKQSNTLKKGDIVETKFRLFKAEPLQEGKKCHLQCDLFNIGTSRCNGFCYRWDNMKDFVFKETSEPVGDYVVIETPLASYAKNEGK